MSAQLPLRTAPESVPDPHYPIPVPEPPRRKLPSGPSGWLTLGLCVAAAVVTAAVLGTLSRGVPQATSSGAAAQVRTAVAGAGELTKSLRIGGTIETLNYAAIRAPRMRGPRDSGRADLTLMHVAEAGSVVKAGAVVAEFELRWLEDHIEDRQSVVVTAKSQLRKRQSDILILKETERQGRLTAKAEYDKAVLDLRTAEVRSAIEAEILKNLVDEARVTWRQLEEEGLLMERVHWANVRAEELQVQEDVLHVERHLRDYERLRVKTPIAGMVVLESMFNKSGQFAQTKEGDQIYPGTLFMRIVDVSNMVLGASVNQVDAQSIRIGNEAVVELDAYPGEKFAGKVADLGAVATASGGGSRYRRPSGGAFVKHIPVRILITNHDQRILPDLSASADIILSIHERGVLVPREAVRNDPGADGEFVYIQNGEEYIRRQVRVGDFSDTEALIDSGLQVGEEVLLSALPPEAGGS